MAGKVLIANRGEIAVRIARALRELSLPSVAIYTDADRGALHVRHADEAVRIGEGRAAYLDAERIAATAQSLGAWAIHPGYGFLSENPHLAEACSKAGIKFIGPRQDILESLGDKVSARKLAVAAGVPVLSGSDGPLKDAAEAEALAGKLGFPVLLKAAHGGGGRGMRVVREKADLAPQLEQAQREANAAFVGACRCSASVGGTGLRHGSAAGGAVRGQTTFFKPGRGQTTFFAFAKNVV